MRSVSYKHIMYVCFATGAFVVAAGCGGVEDSRLSGQVTLDGKPLAVGRVTLVPLGKGGTASGAITDGYYEVQSKASFRPGKYLVRISSRQPTGRKLKHPEAATGEIDEMREVIPTRYNERSELSIEIANGGERQFDFLLESSE